MDDNEMKQHVARKRFGQNFLVDRQVVADIVNAVAPRREACVVEIGPGLGALTEPLLQRVDRLLLGRNRPRHRRPS